MKPMASDGVRPLFEALKQGDSRALAKLLSLAEELGNGIFKELPELLESQSSCPRFGITGPPGAGKSTLISGLMAELRKQGLKVAVLAIDPSSPFTKGAILGDRIRYSEHFLDEGIFIRSIGTRGSLGGLSSSAYRMLRILDHSVYDIVLIETVGVGQTELEIVNVADEVAVVLVPESGDSIQAMKAGLTEIADVFVVNKSDRPGADSLVKEIEAVHNTENKSIKVLKTVATESKGIEALVEEIVRLKKSNYSEGRSSPTRLKQEAMALLRADYEAEIQSKTMNLNSASDLAALF